MAENRRFLPSYFNFTCQESSRRPDFVLRDQQGYIVMYDTTSRRSFDCVIPIIESICRAKDLDVVPLGMTIYLF